MIHYTKEHGCYFERESTGKYYTLYEMETYKGKSTSDAIAIWDHDTDTFVNHVYGANTISVNELDDMVSHYVEEYEAKRKAKTSAKAEVFYRFTKDGIKAFMADAYEDIFKAMDNCNPMTDDYGDHDIYIKIGCRETRIPDLTMCYELLDGYLKDCLKEAFEE